MTAYGSVQCDEVVQGSLAGEALTLGGSTKVLDNENDCLVVHNAIVITLALEPADGIACNQQAWLMEHNVACIHCNE